MKHPVTISKRSRKSTSILLASILLVAPLFSSCGKVNGLEKIRQSGRIIVLTRNNAHCFYTYRDEPMGFEYDLAKAFSQYLDSDLQVVTTHWEELLPAVERGEADLAAASLTIMPSRAARVDFSDPYMTIQQKVILHNQNRDINKLEDLAGKTVHVRRGTSYEERLRELQAKGLKVKIKTYDDTPTEELIEMVAKGEIEVTIADSNIALLNHRYYPDIKIGFSIEKPQALGWVVRKGERELLSRMNAFFRKIKKDGTFDKIYDKYYANAKVFDYLDLKKYHRRIDTRLETYKPIFKKAARQYGFDWRLLAAIAYHESHYDPKALSFSGAGGLMQLSERTAAEMGVEDRFDPEQSIMGGTRYLRVLYNRFTTAKDPDRLLLTLASYNVGRGHVLDARKIARKKDLDPNSWSSLEQTLPLLRHAQFASEAKHGYCRGTQPVRYVERVMIYYDILKRGAISG